MMQKFFLNGFEVSADMHMDARALKNRGSKVFFTAGEEKQRGCTNCGGNGYFHLEYVVGGPFERVPPTVSKKDKDDKDIHIYASAIDDQWYQMKMKGYKCPVCSGVSQSEGQITLEAGMQAQSAINALVGESRVRHGYRQGQRQLEGKAKAGIT